MDANDDQEILLESGTNEVELAEFYLGTQGFGVNVAKIKEFVPYNSVEITKDYTAPGAMIGVFLLRGMVIPLVNLKKHLKLGKYEDNSRMVIIVTEFNNIISGFLVDGINRVHRVSWDDLKPVNPVLKKHTDRLIGTVHVDESDILVLDLEYIIAEIFPDKIEKFLLTSQEKEKITGNLIERRNSMKIVAADDSSIARSSIESTLKSFGYTNLKIFENGKQAYDYVVEMEQKVRLSTKNINEYIDAIVTDIEMPQMDGLTLCKKVKSNLNTNSIIILMFSSLITDQMALKCMDVRANGYTTKPDTKKLVFLLDEKLKIA